MAGLMAAPFVGSSTVLFNKLNGSFPAAGLELLSNSKSGVFANSNTGKDTQNNASSKLIKFLLKNKTKKQKYLLVVSNSNSASEIIIQTGESVMALGGFLGNNNPITLKQFKALVKKGEIRYVITGGQGGQSGTGSNSQIMNWVKKVGKAVSSSKYSDNNKMNSSSFNQPNSKADTSSKNIVNSNIKSNNTTKTANNNKSASNTNSQIKSSKNQNFGGFGDRNSNALYDLKSYTDSVNK